MLTLGALPPLADTETLVGEFEAVLTSDTVPDTPPDAVAANTTSNDEPWPGDNVSGSAAKPLTLNPEPLTLIWDMVTLAVPVLLTATGSVLLVPTATVPKFKVLGFALSWPTTATPLPVRGMLFGELEALLTKEALPLAAVVVVGAKLTLRDVLWPGARLNGSVLPPILNPFPVAVYWEMVAVAGPLFVIITGSVLLVPTVTLPKLTLVGLVVSCGYPPPIPLRETVAG
jgi:hypothetical protein